MNQLNLYSPFWKEALKYLGWLVAILVLWFYNTREVSTSKVIIPETKGTFDYKVPEHKALEAKVITKVVTKTNTVYIENALEQALIDENEKVKAEFAKANDSIKKLMFAEKTKLNTYTSDFENDDFNLNVSGIVEGQIKTMTPSYTKKAKTTDVPQKQTVLRVLLGGSVGTNADLNQAIYKLDLNLQSKKGNMYSAEYLRVGSGKYYLGGVKLSIFNIKK